MKTTYTIPTPPTGDITRLYTRKGLVYVQASGQWYFITSFGTLSEAVDPTK